MILHTHLLPLDNLLVAPDAGNIRVAAGLRGDEGRLGDEERAGSAAALPVILLHVREGDVLELGASEAGEGRKDDAVGKRQIADLDWLEELGDCGRRHDGEIAIVSLHPSPRLLSRTIAMFPSGIYHHGCRKMRKHASQLVPGAARGAEKHQPATSGRMFQTSRVARHNYQSLCSRSFRPRGTLGNRYWRMSFLTS